MDVSDVFLGGTDYVEQEIEASEGLETRQLLYLLKNNGEMCKSAKCGCFWFLVCPTDVQYGVPKESIATSSKNSPIDSDHLYWNLLKRCNMIQLISWWELWLVKIVQKKHVNCWSQTRFEMILFHLMWLKSLISTTPSAPILLNGSSQLLPGCIKYKSEIKIETIVLEKLSLHSISSTSERVSRPRLAWKWSWRLAGRDDSQTLSQHKGKGPIRIWERFGKGTKNTIPSNDLT